LANSLTPPAGTPAAHLRYGYDAKDARVLKTALGAAPGDDRSTLYVFPSLEIRRAHFVGNDYERSADTEVPYLMAHGARLGRVAWEPSQVPILSPGRTHVFLELGDRMGSTAVVLDKATGELVERSTYEGYGSVESDYRPDRWDSFREDYRFTGKEDDVEVGLQYFGKRYYAATLGRWVSCDPLMVQTMQADPNCYAYTGGAPLKSVDPVGLDSQATGMVTFGLGWDDRQDALSLHISTISVSGGLSWGASHGDLQLIGQVRLWNGGVGTPVRLANEYSSKPAYSTMNVDTAIGLLGTVGLGKGKGQPSNQYTYSAHMASPFVDSYTGSFSYGQFLTSNRLVHRSDIIARLQATGQVGERKIYGFYANDTSAAPSLSVLCHECDRSWTAQALLGTTHAGTTHEFFWEAFTGVFIDRNLRIPGKGMLGDTDGTYKMKDDQLRLDDSDFAYRYSDGSLTLTLSVTAPWWANLQHYVHKYVTPDAAEFPYLREKNDEFRLHLDANVSGKVGTSK
jgi:RHS repeat-associated protein